MDVVFVLVHVDRQVLDPAREEGNLHLGRAGIALVNLEVADDLALRFAG